MKRILQTLAALSLLVGSHAVAQRPKITPEAEMPEGIITVTSPAYCSDITGSTKIVFKAPGFKTINVTCFNAAVNSRKGAMETIAKDVPVAADNTGSFTFPANRFPKGPVTLTLTGIRTVDGKELKDNCYLQLYNKNGISGIHGMPNTPPPAAKGMKLVFSDNFDKPLSIGKGPNFKYYDHKPPDGSQDFSEWDDPATGSRGYRFTSFDKPNNPFAKVDNFLRIRASTEAASTGIISTMQGDESGFKVLPPAYFECRFVAPNAIGTWPAFWLLNSGDWTNGGDELDIIEAYGGEGPSTPNSYDSYMICPHAWGQGKDGDAIGGAAYKALNNPQRMKAKGVSSAWYESFHTYGCLITETETIYYCDDIEVGRHKTMPKSWERPHYMLVNLAIGGISGWRIDLSRYNGTVDMYVDYIRAYQGERK